MRLPLPDRMPQRHCPMNFFETLVNSIQDPQAGTQKSDLATLLAALTSGTQSSAKPLPASATESLVGMIGGALKPALREVGQTGGIDGIEALLGSLKQNASSPQNLERTLGQDRMNQMVTKAQQKSGLPVDTILSMLPVILPAVVSLLQSGARSGAAPTAQQGATATSPGNNPLLQNFLDSDNDGEVDMQDLVRLGSKFLQ